jgi:hypothetical protein
MKHLKAFNENSKYPFYRRGEFILFTKKVIDIITAKDIADNLGYKIEEGPFDEKTFTVYCKPGEEKIAASDFLDNYPEFFESWERIDQRFEFVYNKVDELKDKLDSIIDYFSYTDKKKFIDPDKLNKEVDYIIGELQKIKI